MKNNIIKPLLNHTSEETAYVVEDYPYGFRLRTKIRYWIETKKGQGMRFCSQTLNPKTDRWNAPKKGTYSVVLGMGLNEVGYVVTNALSAGGWDKEDVIQEFEKTFAPLTEYQIKAIKYIRASNIANSITTWTVRPESNNEPRQTIEEQREVMNKALNYGYAVLDGKVKE